MRKPALLTALVVAVATSALTVGTGVAGADPGNGAVHYASCPDVTFATNVGGFIFTYCFTDVSNPGGNANAHFSGTLDDLSTAPSHATTETGFGCFAAFPAGGFTTDTRLVVTPSGRVNGICKFHPSS
jgi:hypothetical protein